MSRRYFTLATIGVIVLFFWLGALSSPGLAQAPAPTFEGTIDPTSAIMRATFAKLKYGSSAHSRIKAPRALENDLNTILAKMSPNQKFLANQIFDLNLAAYDISYDPAGTGALQSVVVPIARSQTDDITKPDFKAGDGNQVKIVGGAFARDLNGGKTVIMVNLTDSNKLGFYDAEGKLLDNGPNTELRKFTGVEPTVPNPPANKTATPAPNFLALGDRGALISPTMTCFAVSLAQPCYQLKVKDEQAANLIGDIAKSGVFDDLLSDIYGSSTAVQFDAENAMTTVLGDAQGLQCSNAYQNAKITLTDPVPAQCAVTEIFSAPSTPLTWIHYGGKTEGLVGKNLELIAMVVIVEKEGVQINTTGNPGVGALRNPKDKLAVKVLPIGKYLLFKTDPNSSPANPPSALYLRSDNKDFPELYLPGIPVEGFGSGGVVRITSPIQQVLIITIRRIIEGTNLIAVSGSLFSARVYLN